MKTCKIRLDGRLWIIGKSQFESLKELIAYYKRNTLYQTSYNQSIKLTVPVEEMDLRTVGKIAV